MNTTIPEQASSDAHFVTARPYPPSWIDRLLRWMRSLPVPVPVVLIGIWVALVATVHLTVWHEGILPRWQIDQRVLLINTWIPYSLGLIYYLEKTAGDAVAAFRPALNLADDAFSNLRYEFTVLPWRGTLIGTILGMLLALFSVRAFPEVASPFMDTRLAAFVNTTLSMFGSAFIFAAIYLTYRQLRLIRQTYARAERLDLFRSGELYAFSALTLRMGIGWLIVVYAGVLFFPALVRNIPWTMTTSLVLAVVAVSFVTTLFDIHRRIGAVKEDYLTEINGRLQAAFAELHRRIDAEEVGALAPLREVMDALLVERGVVEKLPTWPWQSGTLAGFMAAVLLPLIVWGVQLLVQQVFGL
ncbi:MAG: hypothetical protein H6649_10940 [Caldilineae bacterium]|nr:hypothetical protein [Anaerolineae bacterium]MCB0201046.1 hypothetical protein [Anaerolineae bacterium]MCB9154558.1 hypothetical protein [Caldilineae bacterium]